MQTLLFQSEKLEEVSMPIVLASQLNPNAKKNIPQPYKILFPGHHLLLPHLWGQMILMKKVDLNFSSGSKH